MEVGLTSAGGVCRPALRGVGNSVERLRDFRYETFCRPTTAQPIPTRGRHCLFYSRRMKADLPGGHSIAEDSLRRASSSEIGFSLPESNSSMRRIISAFH